MLLVLQIIKPSCYRAAQLIKWNNALNVRDHFFKNEIRLVSTRFLYPEGKQVHVQTQFALNVVQNIFQRPIFKGGSVVKYKLRCIIFWFVEFLVTILKILKMHVVLLTKSCVYKHTLCTYAASMCRKLTLPGIIMYTRKLSSKCINCFFPCLNLMKNKVEHV